jgi:putative sugar O-methyltransferase
MLKPNLKHLLHPLRTINVAKTMIAMRFEMHAVAHDADERFADDPRYKLENVTAGFANRQDEDGDDAALLNRICAAYKATIQHPESARPTYRATGWWQQVRDRSLGPVRQALQTHDIAALRSMYSNFFRDPCSTGLTAVPYGMIDVYFGGRMTDLHRRVYLADALYGLDHWKQATARRFNLRDLAIPQIGNPFGVCLEGTLVSARAEFQHHCANKIISLLESRLSTVVEIGGGFGGMAYYLLRDEPEIKYINFDVPESIALASYYLMKALPHKKFLLFGETPLIEEAIADADVVLMPLFEMEHLQTASADVTFSSHAMTDVQAGELTSYLQTIHRVTRNRFLFIGAVPLPSMPGLIGNDGDPFQLEEQCHARWKSHRRPRVEEIEILYSFDRADEERRNTAKDMANVNC